MIRLAAPAKKFKLWALRLFAITLSSDLKLPQISKGTILCQFQHSVLKNLSVLVTPMILE